jgi:TPR repeat protein
LLQDQAKAMELWKQAAELGSNDAHYHLGICYGEGGNLKKAKFYYEAAAMAGNESARFNIGITEYNLGNVEQAVKHWMIAASAGHYIAMHNLLITFKQGLVSRNSIDSTLTAYNTSSVEIRSDARDAYIQVESVKRQ